METFTASPELRSAEDGWHVLVPYAEVSYLVPYAERESIASGAFAADEILLRAGAPPIPVVDGHCGPEIGTVRELRSTPEGLLGRLELRPRREVRGGLSIGFEASSVDRGPAGERRVQAARLVHIAVVPTPAYAGARVEGEYYNLASESAVRINWPQGYRPAWA